MKVDDKRIANKIMKRVLTAMENTSSDESDDESDEKDKFLMEKRTLTQMIKTF